MTSEPARLRETVESCHRQSSLFISDRTVAAHISNIMNKLGLNSRAQIAVWMTSAK